MNIQTPRASAHQPWEQVRQRLSNDRHISVIHNKLRVMP